MTDPATSQLAPAAARVLLLGAALFAACGGDSVKRYYTLENRSAIANEVPPAPLCDRPVVVASVDVASPYDLDKIVFRSGSLEVRFYNYRHWVSTPEEMFAKLLARRFETEYLFPAVESAVHSSRDHLSLFVRLHRLEEVDRGEEWHARLSMSLLLKDDRAEQVLWRFQFDETRPAPENEIRAVVDTLNEIYNDEIDKAIASLRRQLQSRGGCRG